MVWDFANKVMSNKPMGTKGIDGPDDPYFGYPEDPPVFEDPPGFGLPPGAPPDDPPDPGLQEPPPADGDPPPFDGPGGDLEPDVASGMSPSDIAKLPSWLQTLLRNGTLSPTSAASIIRQFIPNFTPPGSTPGTTGEAPTDPMLLAAALTTAYNHFKDSDRYMNIAEKYTDRLDPFGSQRGMYQNQLAQLMTDPESYVKNDPAYQSMLRLSLNPAESKMRARGYGNSGNILSELTRVAGDVTNKYVGDLRKDLGNFGGAQFGPGAAAGLLQTGMQGSINSRNQALGDIFAGIRGSGAFRPGSGSNWILDLIRGFGGGNTPPTTPGTGTPPPTGTPPYNGPPVDDNGDVMPYVVPPPDSNGMPSVDDNGDPMPKLIKPLMTNTRYGY